MYDLAPAFRALFAAIFIAGGICFALVWLVISLLISNPLIVECEKNLPRDQQCVLIAVPEEQSDD